MDDFKKPERKKSKRNPGEEPMEGDKNVKKCSKTKPNLKNTVAKTKGKRKTVRITQEKLDEAMQALNMTPQPKPKCCFRSSLNGPMQTYPLMSCNSILRAMQKCVDQQDWGSFCKYMLHLGTKQTDDRFLYIQLKLAILGLTFDPIAKKNNLLAEFVEAILKHWHLSGKVSEDEARKKIFSIL